MYKQHEQFHFSPSDLTRYMESPFASWMDRFSIEHPDQAPEKDPADALMSSLAQKGYEHEDALEAAFLEQGLNVVKIEGESSDEKHTNTLVAMRQGADVIVQARLELAPFGGYADFLVKVTHEAESSSPSKNKSSLGDWHYEVWDTKLANKLKPTFVIQLCCYAQMLESIQGCLPEFITVALGNGENERLRTSDYFYYYQTLKASFLHDHSNYSPDNRPDPADSKNWADWSHYAESLMIEKDHLFQVATITKGQIKKLNQAGINTMQELATTDIEYVPGINTIVLEKLKAQAKIQKQSAGNAIPRFEIIMPAPNEKSGLSLLSFFSSFCPLTTNVFPFSSI